MSFLEKTFRCDCPVTSALDIVGDKWTLVIIKLMLLDLKKTFKDFSKSDESIAPSILSTRLKTMVKIGLIVKVKQANNKKTNLYLLTQKGLSLTPIIDELALWTHHNIQPIDPKKFNEMYGNIKDKKELHHAIIERYKVAMIPLKV